MECVILCLYIVHSACGTVVYWPVICSELQQEPYIITFFDYKS